MHFAPNSLQFLYNSYSMDWREQSDRDLYLSRTLDHSRGGLVHLFTIYWPETFRGNLKGGNQTPLPYMGSMISTGPGVARGTNEPEIGSRRFK